MKKLLFALAVLTAVTVTSCKTIGTRTVNQWSQTAANKGTFDVKVDTLADKTVVYNVKAKIDSTWDFKQGKRYLKKFALYGEMLNGTFGFNMQVKKDSVDALSKAGFTKVATLIKQSGK